MLLALTLIGLTPTKNEIALNLYFTISFAH